MSHPDFARRFTTPAIILFALLLGGFSALRAQEAVAPLSGPSAVAPAVSEAPLSEGPAVTAPTQAGPRVTPPLERYQATLPRRGSESSAQDSEGSRHTIVISTLALVLIGIIVVLLATD